VLKNGGEFFKSQQEMEFIFVGRAGERRSTVCGHIHNLESAIEYL